MYLYYQIILLTKLLILASNKEPKTAHVDSRFIGESCSGRFIHGHFEYPI